MRPRRALGTVVRRLLRQPAFVVTRILSAGTDHQHLHARRNRAIQRGQQISLDNQHLGRRVVQQVGHLIALEVPVDRAVEAARSLTAQDRINKRRAVTQHHGDDIAILDTHSGQPTGQPQPPLRNLLPVAAQLAANQCSSHALLPNGWVIRARRACAS